MVDAGWEFEATQEMTWEAQWDRQTSVSQALGRVRGSQLQQKHQKDFCTEVGLGQQEVSA